MWNIKDRNFYCPKNKIYMSSKLLTLIKLKIAENGDGARVLFIKISYSH